MCLLLILYWNSMALNSTRKMWIYWNRVYFSDRHIQDGIYWRNSFINISIKSKSQAVSTSLPQLILNIFSVKKLDNYIPACNHLAGQVLNVGDCSHITPSWLLIGWISLIKASYWSKYINISHPGALLYHNKHAEPEIKLISHQIISHQNF